VLQTAALEQHVTPTIPLGTRGTWHGHPFDVVGFQRRSISVDGIPYGWNEYVLFNPYRGFRYLNEYEGHWNDVQTVRELPIREVRRGRALATHRGEDYRHFQHAIATTDFVLGEFPWCVRAGDTVTVDDYVAPPLMLSSESTEGETTWSLGEYTDPVRIWQAFALPGAPETPATVFANEPSPHAGRVSNAFGTFAVLAALLLAVFLGRQLLAAREPVFSGTYTYRPATGSEEAAFVTDTFAIRTPATVEIEIEADVWNNWLDFDLALIHVESGTAFNVEREVGYFSGTDTDGAWSEGGRQSHVLLPTLPVGQYYLRVEPTGTSTPVGYSIRLRRDVPSLLPYPIALAFLLLPPVFVWLRSASFETKRWQESDYGSESGTGSNSDHDSDGDD
jgi:hypothetical protein